MSSKEKLKILHIANWYPSPENPFESIWIKRHIDSIRNYFDTEVFHLEVKPSNKLSIKSGKYNDGTNFLVIHLPTKHWVVIEFTISICLFFILLFKHNWKKFELINFHIAYPLLIHWHLIRKFIKKKIIVNEHYSGYHFNFNLVNLKKKRKIQRIFKNPMRLLTVSESLYIDIEKFCGFQIPDKKILSNTLSVSFKYDPSIEKEKSFFMLSNFNYPKRPEVVLEAFLNFSVNNPDYTLKFGGIEQNDPKISELSKNVLGNDKITFLGKLQEKEIVKNMNQSIAFLHCSEYETFSVVCIEALGCGIPVIASNTGGIREYINTENGLLVRENSVGEWMNMLDNFKNKNPKFNNSQISEYSKELFSSEKIGKVYFKIITDYLNNSL